MSTTEQEPQLGGIGESWASGRHHQLPVSDGGEYRLPVSDGGEYRLPVKSAPAFNNGSVEIGRLLRAQQLFIDAQTDFIDLPGKNEQSVYLTGLTAYSHAQTAIIKAQTAVLHELGVL